MLRPEKGPDATRGIPQLQNNVEILSSCIKNTEVIIDELAGKAKTLFRIENVPNRYTVQFGDFLWMIAYSIDHHFVSRFHP